MQVIKVNNLTKKYKNITAIENLSLEIDRGELFSLLGVNGAGKTTLIKVLSCLTLPTDGDACVFGYSVKDGCDKIKRIIGVSPQETAVAPNLSVKENLELICQIHGFSKKKTSEKVAEMSAKLQFESELSRRAGGLSGGMQRRLSIAMALISEPEILFLDEPTLGLDVIARRGLWDAIKELKGKITIVLTTHYMEEVEALSDRTAIMKDGRLLAIGSVNEIIRKTEAESFEDAFVKIIRKGGI